MKSSQYFLHEVYEGNYKIAEILALYECQQVNLRWAKVGRVGTPDEGGFRSLKKPYEVPTSCLVGLARNLAQYYKTLKEGGGTGGKSPFSLLSEPISPSSLLFEPISPSFLNFSFFFSLLPTFSSYFSLLPTFLGHFSLLPILFLPPPKRYRKSSWGGGGAGWTL